MSKNFVTCHCHPQSLDSASTPEAFVDREKELGTGYVTVTDHGTLQAARRIYEAAHKKGITPIVGLEAYVRDDDCPILLKGGIQKNDKGTFADYQKYQHLTMHFLDEEAFYAGVKILSNAAINRLERHGSEEKPLFSWADLEELGAKNTTFGTGCLVGMVQRHLLNDRSDIATAYFDRLRAITKPGNLYIEVFPHKTDKNWVQGVFLSYEDGTKERFRLDKKLRSTDGEIQAQELPKAIATGKHKTLVADSHYRVWREWPMPKAIAKAETIEDFIANECTEFAPDGDAQKSCNLFMLDLASKYDMPVLISDDSHFTRPEEKQLQDIRLGQSGAWRFYSSYHRQSSEEAQAFFKATLGTDDATFEKWVENTYNWAGRFKDFKFHDKVSLPVSYYPQDTLKHTITLIREHGRMNWKDPAMMARLQKEIDMLHRNGTVDLLPYFFVAEELNRKYIEAEQLTGPGRGSAAGLLLSFLLGITHVNPLRYQLSMERFLTTDRIKGGKLPDIDQDLPSRDIALKWLEERFPGHYAQISVDTTLKLKSAIKDVARVEMGDVPKEIHQICKNLPDSPQGIPDRDFVFGYKGGDTGWVPGLIDSDVNLQAYTKRYPKHWEKVQKLLGLARQKGRHASAYVIMDEPISNRIPLRKVGDNVVTDYTAAWVEKAGGIKMDYLVINSLNDIGYCVKLIQERKGLHLDKTITLHDEKVPRIQVVPHAETGELLDIWRLPEDQAVFREICESKTDSTFQFGTPGAKKYLRIFNYVVKTENGADHKALDSIESISAFTALDRPGPLDYYLETPDGNKHNMLVEYANRAKGKQPVGALPILNELFPETHGVIVYQEQLQKAFQVIGGTTGVQADEFRVHISKKQMEKVIKDKELFMPGAIKKLGEETAKRLWDSIETFGQYGFNKSHATCYAIIGYACQYLRHYYPLEWWTAVLRNAEKKEINDKFWAFCGHLIELPDVNKSGAKFEIQGERIRAPLSLLDGVGDKAQLELVAGAPYTNIEDFVRKIYERRKAGGTVIDIPEERKEYKNGKVKVKPASQKIKFAHSALHRGVISKLIITGSMSSLFPENADVYDMLSLYEEAVAKVYDEKKKPIDPKYAVMNALSRYQTRKVILPAYSDPLLPLVTPMKIEGIEPFGKRWAYRTKNDAIPFATGKEVERLEGMDMLPPGGVKVAVAAYVVKAEKFKWGDGKKSDAWKANLDVDGNRHEWVKWPPRGKNAIDKKFDEPLTGAIVVALLSRWNEKKGFAIDDVIIVQPPLSDEKPEESK